MRMALVLLLSLLTASSIGAQAPPSLFIEAPPELAAERRRIDAFDTQPLATIVRAVGLSAPGPPMRVVLGRNDDEWARQVPPWTAGFAVGSASLIVLFPSRSPAYPHDTLEDVLRHEVAHVLISRAAGGRQVPRWFHEGLAVAVERPWNLEDRMRFTSALLFGPRLGLAAIDELFAGDEGAQQRAYSLSAALVRYLIHEQGSDAPSRILREVARGQPFNSALAAVAGQPVLDLEAAFWRSQRAWTTWIPLIASSTAIWFGVIGLAALAVRRRRQRSRQLRRRWDDEEASSAPASSLHPPPPESF
jgi:MYXO-CTERM domain-containing protein